MKAERSAQVHVHKLAVYTYFRNIKVVFVQFITYCKKQVIYKIKLIL